ncbi:MAG: FecR family protein [Pseudomonadales bacterium]|nr:FecR domain-containing protein [Pseudomonadales bacterium]
MSRHTRTGPGIPAGTSLEGRDEDIRRLLAASGPRPQPPEEMERRVRAAVLDAVDALPDPGRDRFRVSAMLPRVPAFAVAASVLFAVVVAYYFAGAGIGGHDAAAARIAFASGGYTVRGSASKPDAEWIAPGTIVQTSTQGRVLLELSDGVTVRIDQLSSATFHSGREVWLHRGRIYVDAAGAGSLQVTTPNASIRDIGTQFEVSLDGERLTIAVREGDVEVSTSSELIRAGVREGMGEMIALDGMTLADRTSIAPTDPHWQWTQSARPLFSLGGRSVAEYLDWVARETGQRLVFESELVRQQAGLQEFFGKGEADTNVEQILRTTRFQLKKDAVHELVVGFSAG